MSLEQDLISQHSFANLTNSMKIDGELRPVILQNGLSSWSKISIEDTNQDKLTPYLEELRERINGSDKPKKAIVTIGKKQVKGYIFDEPENKRLFVTDSFACVLVDNKLVDIMPFVYFFPHPNFEEKSDNSA